jgi:hypothetical protein
MSPFARCSGAAPTGAGYDSRPTNASKSQGFMTVLPPNPKADCPGYGGDVHRHVQSLLDRLGNGRS